VNSLLASLNIRLCFHYYLSTLP